MNEKELYEKQYGEKKLISRNTFPRLRRFFRGLDLSREDLALRLLDGGDKLIDVGCGNGSFLYKAKSKYSELYGADISTSRIEEARRNNPFETEHHRFHFREMNINERIDFPEDYFDAATSLAVIEHVFDPYRVVCEIYRVLKKGGTFVGEVPNIAYIKHRIQLLTGRLPVTSSPYNWKEIGWDGGHLHYFTKSTFCRLLKECGFSIVKVSGCGLLADVRNRYPSLLTGDICVKAIK